MRQTVAPIIIFLVLGLFTCAIAAWLYIRTINKGAKAMKQFEVGKTYSTRSICDYDCIFSVTIHKRTDKTVTTERGRHKVYVSGDGSEYIMPWGKYSMCPVFVA